MNKQILELLDSYWDAAYQEGIEGRTHDTPDGKAQRIRAALDAALKPGGDPYGWYFTDDPQVVAMPGSGFHLGKEPPTDAVNLLPLYCAAPPAQIPVAWFDDTGQLRGRVSDEQLEVLCQNALAAINSRNGWENEPAAQTPVEPVEIPVNGFEEMCVRPTAEQASAQKDKK